METSLVRAIAPETVHLDKLPKDPKAIPPAYLGFPYIDPIKGYNEKYREIWSSFDALDPRRSDLNCAEKLLQYFLERLKEEVNMLLNKSAHVSHKPKEHLPR
jgi:hypothetical protein